MRGSPCKPGLTPPSRRAPRDAPQNSDQPLECRTERPVCRRLDYLPARATRAASRTYTDHRRSRDNACRRSVVDSPSSLDSHVDWTHSSDQRSADHDDTDVIGAARSHGFGVGTNWTVDPAKRAGFLTAIAEREPDSHADLTERLMTRRSADIRWWDLVPLTVQSPGNVRGRGGVIFSYAERSLAVQTAVPGTQARPPGPHVELDPCVCRRQEQARPYKGHRAKGQTMTTQSHPPEVQYCAKEGCHLTAEDDCRQCRAESKPEYYCWGHSGGHPNHDVSLDPGHIPIVNVPT